jgi:hypothetical protein
VQPTTILICAVLLGALGGVGCGDDDEGPAKPSAGGTAGSGGLGGSGGGGATGGAAGQSGASGSGGSAGSGGGAGTGGSSAGSGGSSGSGTCARSMPDDARCAEFMADTPNAWRCPSLSAASAVQNGFNLRCWSVNFLGQYGLCCPAN